MQEVINAFEERVKEVDLYFETLKNLYKPNIEILLQTDEGTKNIELDKEFLKILKANSFLLIYNLVESSIRDGILAIYRELESKNYSFERVRNEIRQIWIDYHYSNVYDPLANYQSYRNQARKLVEMAINRTTIKLDKEAMGISGNLDADQIRLICDKHGIKKTVSPECKGGEKLQIVKELRNALAHGSLSFSECGRTFTETALMEIKDQAVIFVRCILFNMKEYVDNCLYDIANVRNQSL